MTKKKVLKLQIGEAYDKETKKNLPVTVSYWQNEDGSYSRVERIFVNEVEVPDRESKKNKVEV